MPTYLKIFLASLLSKVLIFFIGKNQKKKINNIFFNLDISEGIDLRLFLNFLEEKNLYKSLNNPIPFENFEIKPNFQSRD